MGRVESGRTFGVLRQSRALDSSGARTRLEGLANLNVYMIGIAVILLNLASALSAWGVITPDCEISRLRNVLKPVGSTELPQQGAS